MPASSCSRCTARFADQLGLAWHYSAAHPSALVDMEDSMTEIKTTKPRILGAQQIAREYRRHDPDSPDLRPWVPALVIGLLFLAAGLGALVAS